MDKVRKFPQREDCWKPIWNSVIEYVQSWLEGRGMFCDGGNVGNWRGAVVGGGSVIAAC